MVRVTGQSGLVWARGDQQGVGSGDGEAERMGMPVGEVRGTLDGRGAGSSADPFDTCH